MNRDYIWSTDGDFSAEQIFDYISQETLPWWIERKWKLRC
jgi:hypothetical protein